MRTFNEYIAESDNDTYGKSKGADYKVLTKSRIQKSSVHPDSWYYVVDVRNTIGNAEQPYMVNIPGAGVFIHTDDIEKVETESKVSPSFQAQMDKLLDVPKSDD